MSQESPEAAAEFASLRESIEQNLHSLRLAERGKHFRIGKATFRLRAQARNVVYQINGQGDWFLKITRDGAPGALAREELGARTIPRALDGHPSYMGSSIIHVSTTLGYVLASQIPGKPLNSVFLTNIWLPGARFSAGLEETFRTLGTLLGTLHKCAEVRPDTLAATTRPFEVVESLLVRAGTPDGFTTAIRAWLDSNRLPDAGHAFQHGNFRLDNILRSENLLGFIDFENCGLGTAYQDLSRPMSELVLTTAVVPFPRERVRRCLTAYLTAYKDLLPVEQGALRAHVGARVARYFLETRAKGFRARIGGLPVSQARLERLALESLDASASVYPE